MDSLELEEEINQLLEDLSRDIRLVQIDSEIEWLSSQRNELILSALTMLVGCLFAAFELGLSL